MRIALCCLMSWMLSVAVCAAKENSKETKSTKPAVEVKKVEAKKSTDAKTEPIKTEIKMAEPAPADPNAMVAKVNDVIITEKMVADEVNRRLETQKKRLPEGVEINDWMRNHTRRNVVEMLIEKELLNQTAAAKNITVTDEETMAEIKKLADQQNIPMENIPNELAKYNITMEDLKGQIRLKLIQDKLIAAEMKDGEVKEEDVKKFYDENPRYFEHPEQVQARHILIKVDENATEEQKAAAKTKAEDLLKQIKEGADFAELAKNNSDCPSSQRGGDLGAFGRGQMVKPFEDAAFALKPGEVSGIVETQFGYHIIKKEADLPASKDPYEKVQNQIKDHLQRRKRGEFWQTYEKSLREKNKIEYSEAEKKLREQMISPTPPMPAEPAANNAEAKKSAETKTENKNGQKTDKSK